MNNGSRRSGVVLQQCATSRIHQRDVRGIHAEFQFDNCKIALGIPMNRDVQGVALLDNQTHLRVIRVDCATEQLRGNHLSGQLRQADCVLIHGRGPIGDVEIHLVLPVECHPPGTGFVGTGPGAQEVLFVQVETSFPRPSTFRRDAGRCAPVRPG